MTTPDNKKLIEVALPLEHINRDAAQERRCFHGQEVTFKLRHLTL